MRGRFGGYADAAERDQLTYRGFLAEVLMAECEDRIQRRTARRIREAGFPRPKRLEDFDYAANPNINPPPSTPWPPAHGSAPANRCA